MEKVTECNYIHKRSALTLKRRVDSTLWKLPCQYQIQSSVLEVLMLWILRKD